MSSIVPAEKIESRIFQIRGKRVLLGMDLAALYGIETRVLNQAVKRNTKRFPDDFMFYLSRDEISRMSQIETVEKLTFFAESFMQYFVYRVIFYIFFLIFT